MILIKNEQNKIPIDLNQLKKDTQIILEILDYNDFDIGILFTTDQEIHKLNKKYRNKDKSTDILSFAYHAIPAGERIIPETDEDKNLGDIIIAPEFVQTDLSKWDQTFKQRLQVLLVHGICHLLGYDHENDDDYRKMQKKELSLLKLIKR